MCFKLINYADFLLFTLDDRHSSNVQTFAEVETLPSDTDCKRNNEKDGVGKNLCCLTRQTKIQCIFSKNTSQNKEAVKYFEQNCPKKTTYISFF